jgi:hypothetical protein
MARIKLIKAKTSMTKRNIVDYLDKYIPYVNALILIVVALRVFKVI